MFETMDLSCLRSLLLKVDYLPVYLPVVLVCLLNAQVTALWCVVC